MWLIKRKGNGSSLRHIIKRLRHNWRRLAVWRAAEQVCGLSHGARTRLSCDGALCSYSCVSPNRYHQRERLHGISLCHSDFLSNEIQRNIDECLLIQYSDCQRLLSLNRPELVPQAASVHQKHVHIQVFNNVCLFRPNVHIHRNSLFILDDVDSGAAHSIFKPNPGWI